MWVSCTVAKDTVEFVRNALEESPFLPREVQGSAVSAHCGDPQIPLLECYGGFKSQSQAMPAESLCSLVSTAFPGPGFFPLAAQGRGAGGGACPSLFFSKGLVTASSSGLAGHRGGDAWGLVVATGHVAAAEHTDELRPVFSAGSSVFTVFSDQKLEGQVWLVASGVGIHGHVDISVESVLPSVQRAGGAWALNFAPLDHWHQAENLTRFVCLHSQSDSSDWCFCGANEANEAPSG